MGIIKWENKRIRKEWKRTYFDKRNTAECDLIFTFPSKLIWGNNSETFVIFETFVIHVMIIKKEVGDGILKLK